MRLLLSTFIIILYSLSAFADHFRISANDYPDCTPVLQGKQQIVKIDNANSKLGRDNIEERFVIKNKEKKVKLKNKITVILMAELKDGMVVDNNECPKFLERNLLYKKELIQKIQSVSNFISFKKFTSKKPIVDYSYPVLSSGITYDSIAKYKPESFYSQITPFNGNIIFRTLRFSLDHYENLEITKLIHPQSGKLAYFYETSKYKTNEKYIKKSSTEAKMITDESLINLIENKFKHFDEMKEKPRRVLFNDEEIEGFVKKISELGKAYRIQTNH